MKPHVIRLLLNSLSIETSTKNSKMLLNLIASFAIHEAEYSEGIFALILRVLQDEIIIPLSRPDEVIMATLEVLSLFSGTMTISQQRYKVNFD